MKYWHYKCNVDGGPAGYGGEWSAVFGSPDEVEWGGSYSTASGEVLKRLDEDVSVGDVVSCYQTNESAIVGFCVISQIRGDRGDRKLYLRPIEVLSRPLLIHAVKRGTVLEDSIAVNGPVMLRELSRPEMSELVRLAGSPQRVMRGQSSSGGFKATATKGD